MHIAAHNQTTGQLATITRQVAALSRLIRLPEVEARIGLKKSTIYAGMAAKTFPAAVRLGNRCVAWHEAEIESWIASRSRVGGVQ